MRKFFPLIVASLVLIGLASCATSIKVEVTKLPTFDTSNVKRLAVKKFAASSGSDLYQQVANYLTATATASIQATGKFTLVSSDALAGYEKANTVADNVDAIFTGTVNGVTSKDSSSTSSYKDKDGNTITVTTYRREVNVSYTYQLIKSRDGSIIGSVNRSERATDSNTSGPGNLTSAATLAERAAGYGIRYVARDVAPWNTIEKRTLVEEKILKDKPVKEALKSAKAQVKAGQIKPAIKAYDKIYDDSGSFAAAYNAAVLSEVADDIEEAINRMGYLFEETGSPVAKAELTRMQKTLAESQQLAEKYNPNDTDSPFEKTIKAASDAFSAKLPAGTNLSIFNESAPAVREIGERAVESLTANLVKKGSVTVLDRTNSKFIEQEKKFQTSGEVSDDSAVSIGKALGANTILIARVAGASSTRRLELKALNVETGALVYQESFDI